MVIAANLTYDIMQWHKFSYITECFRQLRRNDIYPFYLKNKVPTALGSKIVNPTVIARIVHIRVIWILSYSAFVSYIIFLFEEGRRERKSYQETYRFVLRTFDILKISNIQQNTLMIQLDNQCKCRIQIVTCPCVIVFVFFRQFWPQLLLKSLNKL